MKVEASPEWTLVEGEVDIHDDHFKINYGDELQTIAFVGQGPGEVFKVEYNPQEVIAWVRINANAMPYLEKKKVAIKEI